MSNSSRKQKNISAERLIIMKNGKNQRNSDTNDVRDTINDPKIADSEISQLNNNNENRRNSVNSADDMNLELIINRLLTRKDLGMDYLNDIKIALNGLLDYKLEDICTYQKDILLFKKLKQAYEKYIDDLVRNESKNLQIIKQNECLKEENNYLTQKNILLQANLDELKKDNLRINHLLLKNQTQSNSPFKIILNTEKKLRTSDNDSPLITQNNPKDKLDIENLKQMSINQQNTINMYKNKETKMIKLLYIIKKQGIDIDKIYNQDVKGVSEMFNLEEYDLPTIEKNKMKEWNNKSHRSSVALMGKQMEVIISVDREGNADQEDEKEEKSGANPNITKREDNSFDTGTPSSKLTEFIYILIILLKLWKDLKKLAVIIILQKHRW